MFFTASLSWILDNYLKDPNIEIDFLTVDVEGFDYEVLNSNDWNRYRPKVVVFELHASNPISDEGNKIKNLLNNNGYAFYCSSPTNVFYIEEKY